MVENEPKESKSEQVKCVEADESEVDSEGKDSEGGQVVCVVESDLRESEGEKVIWR